MKFPIEEMLAKLPLPANEKWKEGVWDVEPFKLFSIWTLRLSARLPRLKRLPSETVSATAPDCGSNMEKAGGAS